MQNQSSCWQGERDAWAKQASETHWDEWNIVRRRQSGRRRCCQLVVNVKHVWLSAVLPHAGLLDKFNTYHSLGLPEGKPCATERDVQHRQYTLRGLRAVPRGQKQAPDGVVKAAAAHSTHISEFLAECTNKVSLEWLRLPCPHPAPTTPRPLLQRERDPGGHRTGSLSAIMMKITH